MTSAGDNCVFTETNQLNGWGSVQTSYGASQANIIVPGGDRLRAGGGNFTVSYPALGRYEGAGRPPTEVGRWQPRRGRS